MKYSLLLLYVLFTTAYTNAQEVSGRVLSESGEPLASASIFWSGTSLGVYSEVNGKFSIAAHRTSKVLVASFVGYTSDSITVVNYDIPVTFRLKTNSLSEVTVTEKIEQQTITSDIVKTEKISHLELEKGACCDLAGCFNTNASVQPAVTNVLTNAKELRMLGVSGVYNQILYDGFPLIEGLSYTYGVSAIPGPLVGNIYIAKGANSNLQGAAGMSGQINVIPKDYLTADKLFLNFFVNSFGEIQYNLIFKNTFGKKKLWQGVGSFHQTLPSQKIDRDGDNFMDVTRLKRTHLQYRLAYRDDSKNGWHSLWAVQLWKEQRVGGSMDFTPELAGSNKIYGQLTQQEQVSFYQKTGYRFNERHSLQLFTSAYHSRLNSFMGLNQYNAQQTNIYTKAQWNFKWGKHLLVSGIDANINHLPENILLNASPNSDLGNYRSRNDLLVGAFIENTFNLIDNKLTLIGSFRQDKHNRFQYLSSPRMLIKYDYSANNTLRASAGYGYRISNVFAEQPLMMAGYRNIIIKEELQPETAWNYGINGVHRFNKRNVTGYFSADLYYTHFQNQIFPDYNQNSSFVYLSNHTEGSYATAIQIEANTTWFDKWVIKTAYNYLDVAQIQQGQKVALPYISTHNLLVTFSYETDNEKWQFDFNYHLFGPQKLPVNTFNNDLDDRPEAPAYHIMNLQISKKWKKFETYIGCENLLDFRQLRPFLNWEDPFSQQFDPTSAWGPTRGRELYLGLRFKVN